MKKIIMLFTLGMILANNAFAEGAFPNAVIGVIDLVKIQKTATIYKGLLKEREDFIETQKPKIAKKEKELKDEETKILKEKGTLSDDDYNTKVMAFKKKVFELQSEVEKDTVEFNKSFEATRLEVAQNALQPVINEIAVKHGVTVVLNVGLTVFYADGTDITDEVIKTLNSKYPSIKMKKPAKKAPEKKNK